MVEIILASRGDFAKGILQSGEMIFGTQSNVKAVALQLSEGPNDTRAKIEEVITTFENSEQILFMVDPRDGTPLDQTSGLVNGHEDTWTVVTGLDLPMLVGAFASRMSMESAQEIAAHVYGVAKEGTRLLSGALEPARGEQAAEPVTPRGAILEGTVIGNGYIKYMLARIGSRLLHGQVTTIQTKTVKSMCIIVVSDGVVKDELRKSLIEQTTPPSMKVSIVPVDKMIQVAKGPRFGNIKAMLLSGTPQDVLRVIESGVDVKELNIGSMAHSVEKIAVSRVSSLGKGDVKIFEKLKAKRVQSDVRKVPNNSKENMDDIIKKAKAELA